MTNDPVAHDPLAQRAEEIVDVFTSGLGADDRIGEHEFLVKRSDLVHLVVTTIEITLRRISQVLTQGGNE